MNLKILKLIIFIAIVFGVAFLISTTVRRSSIDGINNSVVDLGRSELKLSSSTPQFPSVENPTSFIPEDNIKTIKPKQKLITVSAPQKSETIKEVSTKPFEEIINSSVIQLYCGYLSEDETGFSDISRGTGIIIDSKGEILTNRHIIYDENFKKIRTNCFVLKSPFPNARSEKPKIYYSAEIKKYPLEEKVSEIFSKDKYYNDFAILKIGEKPRSDSKINLLLQTDYASEADYAVLQNSTSTFNYFPIDWSYQPQNDDTLITLGYGIDASHIANQITSTIGRLAGNIDISKTGKAQILLIESNATNGFSGGALINPKSKGLIGLISWITAGDISGKYTVAIFRDFLRDLMLQDLNFDLKNL